MTVHVDVVGEGVQRVAHHARGADPLSHNRSREPEIPQELMRYAKEAVKRCPRLALRLLDDRPAT